MARRLASLLIMVMLSSSLFAASIGYSYSMEGWSGYNESASSRLSLILDPTPDRQLTVEAGAAVGLSGGRLGFAGLNVDLSVRTFSVSGHPFTFLFSNPTLWSPKLSFGLVWDRELDMAYRVGASPFNFLDVHFAYEFLRPFVVFDSSFAWAGWGIDLMRISYNF